MDAVPIIYCYSYHLGRVKSSDLRLKNGTKVRLYFDWGDQDVYVREGVVLNFNSHKNGEPALFLEVYARGIAREEALQQVNPYKRKFINSRIGLVQML